MSRAAKTWLIAPLVLAVTVIALLRAGGVSVSMTNKTDSEILHLRVAYEVGAVTFESVQSGARVERALGKIGEGASFVVQIRRASAA